MIGSRRFPALMLFTLAAIGCTEPKGSARVAGSMKFILGGTSGTPVPAPPNGEAAAPRASFALTAGTEYIVSPRKAKLTFTSVAFKDATGATLAESDLTNCAVTYDRSLTSGSTLLDCPFSAPVGDIAQMTLSFNKTIEILISDATIGIYSDPQTPSLYSTTAPSGGAGFVPFTINIGSGPTRGATIIFAAPVTIAEGTTPSLYVTVDMIHTFQMTVNSGGTTLTGNAGNDPVAVFAGLTPGTSRYYSGATTAEGYKVQGVPSLRVFYDQGGRPLYTMIGPNFCGADDGSPKNAWASPPIGSTIGGWLGKDANNVLAWALATSSAWTTYNAYYVMPEQNTVGQTTVLTCKVTASPPPPADGKTYASGAPALTNPDKSVTLRLLAK